MVNGTKAGMALILHTVKLLQDTSFNDYAKLGVLINGWKEINSPGAPRTPAPTPRALLATSSRPRPSPTCVASTTRTWT